MTIDSTMDVVHFLRSEYGLDEFQAPAANHLSGPALVLACAGSGKTTTLTTRVTHLIKYHQIPAEKILCITFTNKATENMVTKITSRIGTGNPMPTISTIHSLGLGISRKHPQLALEAMAELAGVLHPKDSPVVQPTIWSEKNCGTTFRKICTENNHSCNYSEVLDSLMYLCNRGYTPDSYEAAVETNQQLVKRERFQLTPTEVYLWREYIKSKYYSRAFDFTDMMLIANRILIRNPKVLNRYHERWDYILQDEAQDASPLQWTLLTLLTNSSNNLFCVGDASQCQPPGTMISVACDATTGGIIKMELQEDRGLITCIGDAILDYRVSRGWSQKEMSVFLGKKPAQVSSWETSKRLPNKGILTKLALDSLLERHSEIVSNRAHRPNSKMIAIKKVPIETLVKGDSVISWTKSDQRTYKIPRYTEVASRAYHGPLISIQANEASTRVTPNHWVWTRFNKDAIGLNFVYLMYKHGIGFRVGISNFKESHRGTKDVIHFGLGSRVQGEGANAAWVLRFCKDKLEANTWEKIYSIKYGIPHSVFKSNVTSNQRLLANLNTQEMIDLIFEHADPGGGFRCLQDHNLLFEQPLHLFANFGKGEQHARSNGYFKTAAANLIPHIMDIPLYGSNKFAPISGITSEEYNGLVYSLDVARDHTYLADDLVVGNSIMSFNGAQVELIKGFEKEFRGCTTTLYPMVNNYRSHNTIIDVANAVEKELVGNHPAPMISKAKIPKGTPALSYRVYSDAVSEANTIASSILKLASVPVNPNLNKFMSTPQGQLLARKRMNRPSDLAALAQAPAPPVPAFKLRDIAILVRSKIMIPTIENALLFNHIPYYVRDGKSLLQSKEVMDIMAYLRLCINPYDAASFERSVQIPKRNFGTEGVRKLVAHAKENNLDLISMADRQGKVLTFVSYIGFFKERLMSAPKDIAEHLDAWYSSSAVLYEEEINKASANNPDDKARRIENFNRFKVLLKDIITEGTIETLPDLLDHISLMQDAGAANSNEDKVHIMTAHSVKGLEYEVVFAPCFFEGSIPHRRSKSVEEIDEEARLTYVIVTRAIRQLRISLPRVFASRGSSQPYETVPSRFLAPMLPFFDDANNILR